MRTRFVTAAIAVGALTLAACADDSGGGLFIRQNLAPPANGGCTFTPDLTAPYFARGVISMLSQQPYVLTPLIESRITALEGQESQRTVLVRGARVDVRIESITVNNQSVTVDTSDFPEGTLKFTSLFSAPVAPNGGLSVGDFDLLTSGLIATLRDRYGSQGSARVQVVAEARVFGDLGGDEIESDSFSYPVTVCNDCIVNNLGACPSTVEVRTGNPCNPFQDGVVDCCTSGGSLLCPAPSAE